MRRIQSNRAPSASASRRSYRFSLRPRSDAVRGRILGHDGELSHARCGEIRGLGEYLFPRPAREVSPDRGNRAVAAPVRAAVRDLEVGEMRRREEPPPGDRASAARPFRSGRGSVRRKGPLRPSLSGRDLLREKRHLVHVAEQVHFGKKLSERARLARYEAPEHGEDLPFLLRGADAQYLLDRFLHRARDEGARRDDEQRRLVGRSRFPPSGLLEPRGDPLGVDEILRAPEIEEEIGSGENRRFSFHRSSRGSRGPAAPCSPRTGPTTPACSSMSMRRAARA